MTKPNPKVVALHNKFRENLKKYTDRTSPQYNPQKALGLSSMYKKEERDLIEKLKV